MWGFGTQPRTHLPCFGSLMGAHGQLGLRSPDYDDQGHPIWKTLPLRESGRRAWSHGGSLASLASGSQNLLLRDWHNMSTSLNQLQTWHGLRTLFWRRKWSFWMDRRWSPSVSGLGIIWKNAPSHSDLTTFIHFQCVGIDSVWTVWRVGVHFLMSCCIESLDFHGFSAFNSFEGTTSWNGTTPSCSTWPPSSATQSTPRRRSMGIPENPHQCEGFSPWFLSLLNCELKTVLHVRGSSRKTVSVIDLQVMGKASIVNCVITLEGLAALLAFEVSRDVSIGVLTEDRLSPKSYRLYITCDFALFSPLKPKTDILGGSTIFGQAHLTGFPAPFLAEFPWGNFSMWWLASNDPIWKRGPLHWTNDEMKIASYGGWKKSCTTLDG